MKERELEEKLRQDGEKLEIPESLGPQQIQKKLENAARTKRRPWIRAIAAAAALVLVAGSGLLLSHMKGEEGQDYGELYSAVRDLSAERDNQAGVMLIDRAGSAGLENSAKTYSGEDAATESFSDTNIQVEGVDEGDIVKTDGAYIYILDRDYASVSIVKAEDGNADIRAVISLEDDLTAQDLYVAEDRLSVIGTRHTDGVDGETTAVTYNIKDRRAPEKAGSVTQSGQLNTSRREGSYLYIFSNFYPQVPESEKKIEQYVPLVNGKALKMPEIVLPEKPRTAQYLVMTAIDLENPDRACDREAVLSSGDTFYVSRENIYAASDRGPDTKTTEIRKFSYKDGKIQYQAAGKVKGYFNDSFSMDEYRGSLRMVTTLDGSSGSTCNNVYVLDKNMKETGSILKLAKDERIYSARFLKDMGYFVTYRQTDPLFSVDLSDPKAPKIIGALKIPGFSQYLHFYGKDHLLGIGQASGENGVTAGVKLSMFDISDPADVKEESTLVIKNTYDAEVLSNHWAVMIDPQKNIFGFAASGEKGASYYIYRYDNGFRQMLAAPTGNSSHNVRGLYIGDVFYLVRTDEITSYRMSDFQKIASLKI
ncbi:beta-propeller domain-containing protein [Anaerovorax odorimutans]|uniref:Beta-propeller domain-containing protein n=1 Tax=Anaerovorax odorimutans TaxID=109327 RepID=A0ABT1RTF2_9FIRM|nr:beta-propeller domain-containing protein [Anaerovorax odorimutans]MCQ4638416.1 beta-propeller domain-containing protein [Anaerovorax odorimutans]